MMTVRRALMTVTVTVTVMDVRMSIENPNSCVLWRLSGLATIPPGLRRSQHAAFFLEERSNESKKARVLE
jgi:hypothetical protein